MFYTNVQVFGNRVKAKVVNSSGVREIIHSDIEPALFVHTNEESEYKNIHDTPLRKLNFESVYDARNFIKESKEVGREVYGTTEYHYDWIRKNFKGKIAYDFSKINVFNLDIEVAVEKGFPHAEQAAVPVNSITLKFKDIYYVFCYDIYGKSKYKNTRSDVVCYNAENEKDLLKKFVTFWIENDPDILTGWNLKFFDIPYLVNRIGKVLGESWVRKLSPFRKVDEKHTEIMGKDNQHYEISGVAILDYLDLYKKYRYKVRENYKLDYIGHVELGLKKLSFDEATHGYQMFRHDFQKFIDYNIRDVEIVDGLDAKFNYLFLATALAYDAKINYDDVHSPVRLWEAYIAGYLQEKNVFAKTRGHSGNKVGGIVGGYVKEPKIGFSHWVLSFDLDSLYPSIIRTLNIGPETIVEGDIGEFLPTMLQDITIEKILDESIFLPEYAKELEYYNVAVGANGTLYSKETKSFMSDLVGRMFIKRVEEKQQMKQKKKLLEKTSDEETIKQLKNEIATLDASQMSKKIALNSLYGALANIYFSMFDVRHAEAITKTGQAIIRWTEKNLNIYLNKLLNTGKTDYIIASDTDSVYIDLSVLVKKVGFHDKNKAQIVDYLDKIAEEKLVPKIAQFFDELCKKLNIRDDFNYLNMKREVIADKAVWTAKKRYAMNVYDDEGVRLKSPEIKITGIESVRSSTPEPCRDKLKEALRLVLTKEEKDVIKFIGDFKKEFKSLKPEVIAFPRSVNGLLKYHSDKSIYTKGTPMHTRGSLLYNNLLRKHKLEETYPVIEDGEKIKFIFLKEPNILRENVISMASFLPEEFGLHKYIDYDMQFQKSFVEPLRGVLTAVGWKTEHAASLEGLF